MGLSGERRLIVNKSLRQAKAEKEATPLEQDAPLPEASASSASRRPTREPGALGQAVEQLATAEVAINWILEGLSMKEPHAAFFCREYWGSSASKSAVSLEELTWDVSLRRQLQKACVLEYLGLAATSQLSSAKQRSSVTVRLKLRTLMHNIYENCLVIMDLLRRRWQEASRAGTHCLDKLDFDVYRPDRARELRDGKHITTLSTQSETIIGILQTLVRDIQSSTSGTDDILSFIGSLFAEDSALERTRASTVRSSLLQRLCFQPLSEGSDSGQPEKDPYERFGTNCFATEGEGVVVLFEPLPPMIPDIEAGSNLLPPPQSNWGKTNGYTLVLDLDETLIYSPDGSTDRFNTRPGVSQFLRRMNSLGYELVTFTTATQDYADSIIDQIDPQRLIRHRFYRQHTLPWGPLFLKDLSRLGRNLDKVVIIDNMPDSFMLQPDNGIHIKTWYDDSEDRALLNLIQLLEQLQSSRKDVPTILKQYRKQIPQWAGVEESPSKQPSDGHSHGPANMAAGPYSMTFVPMFVQTQPWTNDSQTPAQPQMMFPAGAFVVPAVQGQSQWAPAQRP